MKEIILDVRERDEFEAEHVAGSIHVPLSHFASMAPGVLEQVREKSIVILCRSGARARIALEQSRQLGFADLPKVRIFEGGVMEWKRQGLPTISRKRSHLPLMRQVQLIAGSVVLTASLAAYWVHPAFSFLAAFFGAGLSVAGATGFCGMAELLARMPFNRIEPATSEELCQVSPAGTCKTE
jgi:rhodanese-related sulfurtransferase